MCGRFSLSANLTIVSQRFGVPMPTAESAAWTPHYNITPTKTVVVVGDDGARYLTQMRWGLIPSWAKDPSIGNRMINARAETVATKPAFRSALRKRRCLIAADGFYEWQKRGRTKQPFHIVLKSREPFGFAGLWDEWTDRATGQQVRSCTIITTEPNQLLSTIHDRMPVILPAEAHALWLDRNADDPDVLRSLLKPYPSEEMEAYQVSTLVNSVRNDVPECALPAGLPV